MTKFTSKNYKIHHGCILYSCHTGLFSVAKCPLPLWPSMPALPYAWTHLLPVPYGQLIFILKSQFKSPLLREAFLEVSGPQCLTLF